MDAKSLKPLVPFLPFIIVVVGLLKAITFYRYFGININDYISLSEVTILFADSISLTFFLLLLPFMILMAIIPSQKGYPFDQYDIESRSQNVRKKWYKSLTTISAIFLLLFCITALIFGNYIIRVQFFIILLSIIAVIVIREMYYSYYEKNKEHFNPFYFTITMGFMMFFGIIIYMELVKASSVEHGLYNGTKIYTNDSIYVANSTNIYVGKTDQYIFMYNTIDKSPTILPIREVKKLTLFRWKSK